MSGGTATEAARRVAAEIVRTVLRWDGGDGYYGQEHGRRYVFVHRVNKLILTVEIIVGRVHQHIIVGCAASDASMPWLLEADDQRCFFRIGIDDQGQMAVGE